MTAGGCPRSRDIGLTNGRAMRYKITNLAHVPGRRPGDSVRRGECGSRGSRLVTLALGRFGQDTPGRHHDRSAGAISLDWDSKARVTPASDAWRPAVGFASCVAMCAIFRTIGVARSEPVLGSRVARAERWRSVATASAVVERREASAPQGARRIARCGGCCTAPFGVPLSFSSLRGAKRRSNPDSVPPTLDCFVASLLAMTTFSAHDRDGPGPTTGAI